MGGPLGVVAFVLYFVAQFDVVRVGLSLPSSLSCSRGSSISLHTVIFTFYLSLSLSTVLLTFLSLSSLNPSLNLSLHCLL